VLNIELVVSNPSSFGFVTAEPATRWVYLPSPQLTDLQIYGKDHKSSSARVYLCVSKL